MLRTLFVIFAIAILAFALFALRWVELRVF